MTKPAERSVNALGDFRIKRRQFTDRILLLYRDRHSVAVRDASAGGGADAFAGRDDAREVERVGGADVEDRSCCPRAPDRSQPFDSLRQGKLLPRHAGYEVAAS